MKLLPRRVLAAGKLMFNVAIRDENSQLRILQSDWPKSWTN
jgi:hypothetical protein